MTDDTDAETQTNEGERSRDAAASPETVDRVAREFTKEGRPFARVTVVRREAPVSAHVGDRAIITPDGELLGWIGGVACAQSVAIREAQAALRDGTPKLVGIAPDPDSVARPGLEAFPMTCHSQGTLELFIEPVTTAARLVVVGDSPIGRAVVRLASELSFEVTAVVPRGSEVQGADEVKTATDDVDALAAELRGATWVVAASMGATDDVTVAAALDAGVPYIGLVSSRRRADELCERVADRTGRSPDDVREAVTSPAGLDIGAKSPEEVGVSVLAELVAVRRTHETGGVFAESVSDTDKPVEDEGGSEMETEESEPEVVTDPVCGMDVVVGEAAVTATHEGTTYHFCGVGCQETFVDDPPRFLERVES
ncbi:xanthine dehydrogenase [Salinigranum rubrum]|uniref:Xanthine dehydrogenase n=1 Tax=Salinigranum rubrum TaxID=755307 RepID=A0A2I8VKG6_9EURY|nr:XdhC family protein [Salinigranum rubrum]AUV82423.1 xanthine dehydrogenase [Salinigranum rubrum]